jgi:two-component system phosphate regulon response regulator OmpR
VHDTEDSIARALLGRPGPLAAERFLRRGDVTLDREKNLVFLSSGRKGERRTVDLTASETALLARLMRQPTRVLSCRALARDALNYDVFEREAQEIVRPHISRLRQKIESDPAEPRLIHTVRGKGYMFSAS